MVFKQWAQWIVLLLPLLLFDCVDLSCMQQNIRINGESETSVPTKSAGQCEEDCARRRCPAWTWEEGRCQIKRRGKEGSKVIDEAFTTTTIIIIIITIIIIIITGETASKQRKCQAFLWIPSLINVASIKPRWEARVLCLAQRRPGGLATTHRRRRGRCASFFLLK